VRVILSHLRGIGYPQNRSVAVRRGWSNCRCDLSLARAGNVGLFHPNSSRPARLPNRTFHGIHHLAVLVGVLLVPLFIRCLLLIHPEPVRAEERAPSKDERERTQLNLVLRYSYRPCGGLQGKKQVAPIPSPLGGCSANRSGPTHPF
jgi:hypothetical protein